MLHFVGAGPGAEDLITVRGLTLLQKADVVIYAGSLVNKKLLEYTKTECEIYNSATMNLQEIIEVIEKTEEKGLMTVRLHTGDPSIYGAIREQMDLLREKKIEFDICPGVSSFCGAAASLQMEYTLPSVSQSIIITRMAGRTAVPEKEEIKRLAVHQATMVIFLSTGLLKELTLELIEGGYPANTPAAIVYKATWPEEKKLLCTIETLEETARLNEVKKTALIIVGNVLGNTYEFSKLYDAEFTTEYRNGKKA